MLPGAGRRGSVAGYSALLVQQRDTQTAQAQALAELMTELDRPGATYTTLRTSNGAPVVAVLATTTTQAVVVSGLEPNDAASSVYVVRGIGAATPQPLGGIHVTGTGPRVDTLGPPWDGEPFTGYAISLELAGTAPAVPTTVVASGQVAG